MNNFKSDIEDFNIFDEPKAQFILNESKLYLQSSLEMSDKLDSKGYVILGILFAVIFSLVGFFINRYNFSVSLSHQNWALFIPVLFTIGMCLWSARSIIKSYTPQDHYPLGNEPKSLLTNNFCNQPFQFMLFNEASNYQQRIDQNKSVNILKSEKIITALKRIFWIPIIGITLFLVLHFCFPPFLSVSGGGLGVLGCGG